MSFRDGDFDDMYSVSCVGKSKANRYKQSFAKISESALFTLESYFFDMPPDDYIKARPALVANAAAGLPSSAPLSFFMITGDEPLDVVRLKKAEMVVAFDNFNVEQPAVLFEGFIPTAPTFVLGSLNFLCLGDEEVRDGGRHLSKCKLEVDVAFSATDVPCLVFIEAGGVYHVLLFRNGFHENSVAAYVCSKGLLDTFISYRLITVEKNPGPGQYFVVRMLDVPGAEKPYVLEYSESKKINKSDLFSISPGFLAARFESFFFSKFPDLINKYAMHIHDKMSVSCDIDVPVGVGPFSVVSRFVKHYESCGSVGACVHVNIPLSQTLSVVSNSNIQLDLTFRVSVIVYPVSGFVETKMDYDLVRKTSPNSYRLVPAGRGHKLDVFKQNVLMVKPVEQKVYYNWKCIEQSVKIAEEVKQIRSDLTVLSKEVKHVPLKVAKVKPLGKDDEVRDKRSRTGKSLVRGPQPAPRRSYGKVTEGRPAGAVTKYDNGARLRNPGTHFGGPTIDPFEVVIEMPERVPRKRKRKVDSLSLRTFKDVFEEFKLRFPSLTLEEFRPAYRKYQKGVPFGDAFVNWTIK